MSDQNYYSQPEGNQSNNPYNQQTGGSNGPPAPQQQQQQQNFSAPPGNPPQQGVRRADTFEDTSLIPEAERGEQREAMEQFEMSKSGTESQTDKDVAQLQQEFPGVDGSLIAAIYGDSGMGGARETLQELAGQTQ